ncbi:homeodomain-like protein [Tanacetum coccineum]|uniref:Homeodomain-like protein n=1 Tax=Tanacetum coccineum TaxID=301880 RepID=A0ABQ4YD91_9ASTR
MDALFLYGEPWVLRPKWEKRYVFIVARSNGVHVIKCHMHKLHGILVHEGCDNNAVGALMNVLIFVGTFFVMTDFAVLENIDAYRDEGMGDVIFSEPFLRESDIKSKRFEGMITLYKGDDEVTYQMVRSHPRFKHHTNKKCNKIPPLLKVNEKDVMHGVSHAYQKLKGFYKGVLNLGPDYIRNAKTEEWLTRGHISVHEVLYKVEDIATCLVKYVKFWDDWEVDRYGNANLGRYGVSVPALTKDHKRNEDQYAVSRGLNTPYSRYGINIIFWKISNVVPTLRNPQYAISNTWIHRDPDNSTNNVLIPLDSWISGLLVYKFPLSVPHEDGTKSYSSNLHDGFEQPNASSNKADGFGHSGREKPTSRPDGNPRSNEDLVTHGDDRQHDDMPRSPTFASFLHEESSQKKVNFRTLETEQPDLADVLIHMWSVLELTSRFEITQYGKVSSSFQFSCATGLEGILDHGPWLIPNAPFILRKLTLISKLSKEELTYVHVWIKCHGVLVLEFTADGLSAIATRLGTLVLLDPCTVIRSMQSLGRMDYARALVDIRIDQALNHDDMQFPKRAMVDLIKEGGTPNDGFQTVQRKGFRGPLVSKQEDIMKHMDDLVDNTRKKGEAPPKKKTVFGPNVKAAEHGNV